MKGILKVLFLTALLAAGIYSQKTGLLDLSSAATWAEQYSHSLWLALLSVAVQLIMYMLAFPGSIIMWSLGVIYQPWAATILVTAGGVTGGVAAYYFALFMSSSWTAKFSSSKAFTVLQRNSGFLQLCALRCLPGFPHSFINYSSGILRVSLFPFIMSTALGFAVKGFIYCSAIYTAFHLEENEAVISISNLWPLAALVLFSLLGAAIQKKYFPA